MKIILNKPEKKEINIPTYDEWLSSVGGGGRYWCVACRAPENIVAMWTSTVRGISLVDEFGRAEENLDEEHQQIEIDRYECRECGNSSPNFELMIITDPYEVYIEDLKERGIPLDIIERILRGDKLEDEEDEEYYYQIGEEDEGEDRT